jgi:transcriptional regulator with XRE-family HTH domain
MVPSRDEVSPQGSNFGVLLRQLRGARGWTQEKLAREADITVTSVSNLERGETRPNEETITKLAAAFGMTPSDLDPRRLAKRVAEMARTLVQRQAIGRLLTLSDRDIEAVTAFIDERAAKGKPQRRGKK